MAATCGGATGTGTVLYLESEQGDFIGGGNTYRYTNADSAISVSSSGARVDVTVVGDERWEGHFAGPGSQVEPGDRRDLRRYPFFDPGLDLSGDGRGCSTVTGRFLVDRVLYEAGVMDEVVLRFEQHCGGAGPALRGYLRYDADDTTAPPPPPPPSAFGWRPPADQTAGSGTRYYLEGDPGSPLRSRSYAYTKADAVFSVSTDGGHLAVSTRGDEAWSLDLAEPRSYAAIVPGAFQGLQRYPFHNPKKGGIDAGFGCNTVTGQFAVDRVLYRNGVLDEIVVRFEQRCEGTAPAVRGFFRYDADDPTQPPPPPPASTLAYRPPPGATPATGSYLYFQSSSGDFIGEGRTDLHAPPTSSILVSKSSGRVSAVVSRNASLSQWDLAFTGPDAQATLQPGAYVDVGRWPFHNATRGGFELTGEGRGCNRLRGTFAVDEVTYRGGELQSVAIRFEQRCEETGAPLYGAFRWERPPG